MPSRRTSSETTSIEGDFVSTTESLTESVGGIRSWFRIRWLSRFLSAGGWDESQDQAGDCGSL